MKMGVSEYLTVGTVKPSISQEMHSSGLSIHEFISLAWAIVCANIAADFQADLSPILQISFYLKYKYSYHSLLCSSLLCFHLISREQISDQPADILLKLP